MEHGNLLQRINAVVQDLGLIGKYTTYNELLNADPKPEWINKHPDTGQSYLPIGTVEWILKAFFPANKIEVINYGALFNSAAVHVRVHYLHPGTGEWLFQDGLGAKDMQTDKGATAADMTKIKFDAAMKGLPAAESYAVKDACEKIGNIFGANLTRKDSVRINSIYTRWTQPSQEKE